MMRRFLEGLALLAIALVFAQAPGAGAQATQPAEESAAFKQEELDQMLAPLALYPDSLLTQILMASTYPIEIVQADRWVKANKDLKGDALAVELEKQTWDPAVKSLVNFPEVLASLSEKLDWTMKIGDAFIANQKAVLDTVQKLRGKAHAQGNLQSNQQQTVTVEAANTPAQVIVIESSEPDTVYVPAYNPATVYGSWWYPSYPPPVYYQPPYYPLAGAAIGFGAGFACGAAWGYAFGDCDWNGGDVDIDVDQNFNRNTNIDRDKIKNEMNNRGDRGDRTGRDGAGRDGAGRDGARGDGGVRDGKGKWQHDSSHRKGASYRDQATASKFGGTSSRDAVQARESYRGRADAGRQQLNRGGTTGARPAAANRAGTGATPRSTAGAGNRAGAGGRGNTSVANRTGTTRSSGALSGSSQRGSSVRSASSRGASSRSSASRSSGSRSRSSASRSSGGRSAPRSSGGSRGGGSRGGGGRGGGGRR